MGRRRVSGGLLGLPPELLTSIVARLDADSRIRVPLVCRQLLEDLGGVFAGRVTDLRLVLEDGWCRVGEPVLEARDGAGGFHLAMCQCPPHVPSHASFLHYFLGLVGLYLRSIIVEDFLLGKECRLSAETLGAVLDHCPLLHTLELHDVDLSDLPQTSLARITELRSLKQLAIADCQPGQGGMGQLSDRLLVGWLLSAGLCQLILTRCAAVTDKSLAHVASHCPNLWLADFSGCQQVTAIGVSEFCVSLKRRVPDMLWLVMGGTDVCGLEMERILHQRPAAKPRKWEWTAIQTEVGCAYAIATKDLPNKTILLTL